MNRKKAKAKVSFDFQTAVAAGVPYEVANQTTKDGKTLTITMTTIPCAVMVNGKVVKVFQCSQVETVRM